MTNSFSWSDVVKDAGASSGGSGGSYEPFPPGTYDFKIEGVEAKTSGNGKPMFVVKAQVQNGPHANRLVWDNLVVSTDNPNALGYFFKKMAALGLPKEWFNQNPSNDQIVQALTGRPFSAEIYIDTYNPSSPKNKIKNYFPPQQGGAQGFPQAQQAQAAPAPQAAPQQQAPAPAPAPTPAPQPGQTAFQSQPSQIGQPAQAPAPAPSAPANPWNDGGAAAPPLPF